MYAYIFKVFIESWQGNIEVLNMAKRKKRAKKSKKRVAKQRLTFFKSALYFGRGAGDNFGCLHRVLFFDVAGY